MSDLLIVVAAPQEAAYLHDVDVVLTGVGKVAAAVAVSVAIAERRPGRVLNIGTAGALHDGWEGVHRIGRVVEHDVDHVGIAALVGGDVGGEVVLDPDVETVLATGDAFVAHPDVRRALAQRAHLVDMEGFAIAKACEAAGVPCEMVKVVSDTASEGAERTWVEQADVTARIIADVVADRLG